MASAGSPDAAQRSVVRGEQLFAKAKALQAKLEEKRKEMPVACTFKPQLVTKRAETPKTGKSRFDRLYEAGVASQNKLAEKRAEAEAATPSFKPKLIAKSADAAKTTRAGGNVFSSLYTRGVQQRMRQDEAVAAAADPETTFSPATNANKGKKVTKKVRGARRRLYDADKLKAKEAELEALREAQLKESCTFVPKTNAAAASLSPADKAKRTAVYDKLFADAKKTEAKIAAAKAAAEAAEAAALTFTPAINRSGAKGSSPVSKARAGAVGDRLFRSGVESRARREEASAASGMEGCTFKPQISKASAERAAKARASEGAASVHDRLFQEAAAKPKRSDAGEPKIAWETLLRPEGEAAPTVKPIQLTPGQQAKFDRLYREHAERAAKLPASASASAFEPRPDWELLLRDESASVSTERATTAGPVDEATAAKRDAFYNRLFEEAKTRAAAAAEADAAVPAKRTPSKAEAAKAVAASDRLYKTELKGHAAADMEAAAAEAQAVMLRNCWHATLRTEHPVATMTVPVEAV
uniref:Uncharacterized protein n=1 Tax=Bicosoecida sp. CB-2014 TaxID=1486930 RepID=A0A7S1G7W5_9STRA|mmetsp:Transcript_19537/g.69173  ORF Transcript_19537/g.69173 Transcript_19537/m.69173 type:complete len:527 (+) Transcript_19537:192-1772(+)